MHSHQNFMASGGAHLLSGKGSRRLSRLKKVLPLALAFAVMGAQAQWRILDAHTTADLNAVEAVDSNTAWTAGADGTILRTEDGGKVWQRCAVPPGGDKLDFQSIQAVDAKLALVMSGGKGGSSRLYKTTDGCQTWIKVFDNPNPAGSFNSLRRTSVYEWYLLCSVVDGKIMVYTSQDGGDTWSAAPGSGLEVAKGSGSTPRTTGLTNIGFDVTFGTFGEQAGVYAYVPVCTGQGAKCTLGWVGKPIPIAHAGPSAGVYSLSGRTVMVRSTAVITGVGTMPGTSLIAVGGDERKPDEKNASAAFSADGGGSWRAAANPPGGFRSAVGFDGERDRFIAVGPNGTDVSDDDGNDWRPLKPGAGDPADADRNWIALSLPFVVGPHGHIGTLRTDVPAPHGDGN